MAAGKPQGHPIKKKNFEQNPGPDSHLRRLEAAECGAVIGRPCLARALGTMGRMDPPA